MNSLSVLFKIATGLVTSKLLAIFVGPSGMALVGNLRNFMTTIESVSTLGFQNGIVKYAAENRNNKIELNKFLSTVFITLSLVAVMISLGLFCLADYCNNQIFGSTWRYQFVFKALAIALPWSALSIFFLSVINGFGQFRKVIFTNIFGNLIGLLLSIFLIYQFKTFGALLSIVVAPSVLIVVTFYYLKLEIDIFKMINFKYFDFKIIKNLASFSAMALVSAIFCPIVYLAIRQKIILNLGLDQAGFFETISRISTYYLLFVTTILTVYYLPKLILAKTNLETKKVFYNYYKYIFTSFLIGAIVIYFSRFLIIDLLFTKAFAPVTNLFFWQLVGDIFKVASFILGFNFFAKKLTTAFIVAELSSLVFLYFTSIYCIEYFAVEGAVIAYAIENFVYFVALAIYFRKSLL